jgi:predicted GNAT superfamily acetyltransferase
MGGTRCTDLRADCSAPRLVEACAAAEAAAGAAGVEVRSLHALDELRLVRPLFQQIWGGDETEPLITTDLLRAMSAAGSYVAGAFDGVRLVGACVGFFAEPARRSLHSHITGAAPGRRVGFALKLHQRAWALLRGVVEISWTYDPLIRRNAYFNLGKLAARPVQYLPNFYGRMHDEINAMDDSDRVLVSWSLAEPDVVAACAGEPRPAAAEAARAAGAAVALSVDGKLSPVPPSATTVLVGVPADIEGLRRADSARGAVWRTAVRDVLGSLLAEGAYVSGFDPAGWYIVQRSVTP